MLTAFYIFAFVSVISALGVLIFRSPIYNAMSLVATFFSLGAIYVLLNAEFVAVIQVLVYAGAIMVLFLFVLMLFPINKEEPATTWTIPKLIAVALTVGIIGQFSGIFLSDHLKFGVQGVFTPEVIQEEGSIALIGRLLYGEYVLPFEAISVLLLVAVIGAVVIAKKHFNQ